jgi:hypothetical protein
MAQLRASLNLSDIVISMSARGETFNLEYARPAFWGRVTLARLYRGKLGLERSFEIVPD